MFWTKQGRRHTLFSTALCEEQLGPLGTGLNLMPIPHKFRDRFIYHFTHIDNLPGILKSGFLCKNHCDFRAGKCRSIAEDSIQARRAEMDVTCGPGGKVHDYVPLYFGSKSPMLLAVVQKKNVDQFDILYFEFPIDLLCRKDVVFTDASANTSVPPNFYCDPADLAKLNWEEIDSLKWTSANADLKHQRMAEILVHSSLKVSEATRIVVWNDHIEKRVAKIAAKTGAKLPPIEMESSERYHWFTKFFSEDQKKHSLVCGPRSIKAQYAQACREIASHDHPASAPFKNLKDLLLALRKNFGCLPETSELVGLKSANGMHKKTVDLHTLDVVTNLKKLARFKDLTPEYQDMVELAAFLHDIGKGPKKRWEKAGGEQQVDPDHAVGAMPMMVEVLTDRVAKVKQEDADFVVKLVCYHDLVGEVIGKGRDEEQIVDIVGTEDELIALFALGEADATSLAESWWNQRKVTALYDRCLAAIKSHDNG